MDVRIGSRLVGCDGGIQRQTGSSVDNAGLQLKIYLRRFL